MISLGYAQLAPKHLDDLKSSLRSYSQYTFRLGVIHVVHVCIYVCVQYIQIQCVSFYVRSALSTITTRSVSAHVAFRRRAWSNRVRDTFATRKRDANPFQTRTSFQCALPTFWAQLYSLVLVCYGKKKRREKEKYIYSKLWILQKTLNRNC